LKEAYQSRTPPETRIERFLEWLALSTVGKNAPDEAAPCDLVARL